MAPPVTLWTDDVWRRARKLRDAGRSYGVIAQELGMTQAQVANRFVEWRRKGASSAADCLGFEPLSWDLVREASWRLGVAAPGLLKGQEVGR